MEKPKGVWFFRRGPMYDRRWISFAYLDTDQYLADNLFVKYEVPVDFGDEMKRPGEKYLIIFARCKKKYESGLVLAMSELANKMLICGNTDFVEKYEEMDASFRAFCEQTDAPK